MDREDAGLRCAVISSANALYYLFIPSWKRMAILGGLMLNTSI